jgi:hypothetical protein
MQVGRAGQYNIGGKEPSFQGTSHHGHGRSLIEQSSVKLHGGVIASFRSCQRRTIRVMAYELRYPLVPSRMPWWLAHAFTSSTSLLNLTNSAHDSCFWTLDLRTQSFLPIAKPHATSAINNCLSLRHIQPPLSGFPQPVLPCNLRTVACSLCSHVSS